MSDKLTPDRAIRLLRAKANELEAKVEAEWDSGQENRLIHADIALIATLLADFMEYVKNGAMVWGPEDEDWGTDDMSRLRDTKLSPAPDDEPSLEQSFREGFDEGRPDE